MVVRWAREESRLGGEVVAAGHHVLVNLSAANLDPAEFADPLAVRFDRAGNRHLAFGGGAHRCLGSHLARRELRIALREWHRRIPEYTLSSGYVVRYRPRCVSFPICSCRGRYDPGRAVGHRHHRPACAASHH